MKLSNVTLESPYVFKIQNDKRDRVYPTTQVSSIVNECLSIDDTRVSQIEMLTESQTFIVVSDHRVNTSVPINKSNLTGYIIRWVYDDDLNEGRWVLAYYCRRILTRLMYESCNQNSNCSICVPSYKQSDEFKHFLPFIWNVAWNDIV